MKQVGEPPHRRRKILTTSTSQAIVWAYVESQYQCIKDHTLGIVFFGTPHRGSDKAAYGKILSNVATSAMHRPKSKLLDALQSNSETLMKLTSEFKYRTPNIQIASFYETRPIRKFSSLASPKVLEDDGFLVNLTLQIVPQSSALMEIDGEDQQPVDADHRLMCKFDSQQDEIYKKLIKRLQRMQKGKATGRPTVDCKGTSAKVSDAMISVLIQIIIVAVPIRSRQPHNKYYEVPHRISPIFTGRDDIAEELHKSCLPPEPSYTQKQQKRYVLHGLGGSGKTQICLRFAEDNRER